MRPLAVLFAAINVAGAIANAICLVHKYSADNLLALLVCSVLVGFFVTRAVAP